jgi:S-adenosyl methyltransferase
VPNARTGARENRAFLGRAVRYLVAEAGVRQFLDIGSGLPTGDYNDPALAAGGVQAVQRAGVPFQLRTSDEFADLAFAGLELIPPGLVPVSEWRPDAEPGLLPRPVAIGYYGALGRKPVTP